MNTHASSRPKRSKAPLRAAAYLAAFLIVTGLLVQATAPRSTDVPNPNDLLGIWQVDLRPTPDAEAYYQPFTVTAINGNTFTGTFYQSEIREARLNTDWGVVHFAFVTNDGSGDYHTAGRLIDGRLEGTTHALGRNFLTVWTATRPGE